jgi:hypothetical protein
MPNDLGWKISVQSGLSAHFKQPAGPSKAGADWVVVLTNRAGEKHLFVRIYDDNIAKGPKAQAEAVAAYVHSKLESGWNPDEYSGQGELVVPTDFNPGTRVALTKPWWKFW